MKTAKAILLGLTFLAWPVSAAGPTDQAKKEETPEKLEAVLRGAWTELRIGTLFTSTSAPESIGVILSRADGRISLRTYFNEKLGGESPLLEKELTEILDGTLAHYRTAHAQVDAGERAQAAVGKRLGIGGGGGVAIVVTATGASGEKSVLNWFDGGFPPFFEWLGRVLLRAPGRGEPGDPPEKVERALSKPWKELQVTAFFSDGCTGPRTWRVNLSRSDGRIRIRPSKKDDGELVFGKETELSEKELAAICAEMLKHYRAAFQEHDMYEQSVGEEGHSRLEGAVHLAKGGGQPIGGSPFGGISIETKGEADSYSVENLSTAGIGQLLTWIEKFGSAELKR
jgi:hypothetical protein